MLAHNKKEKDETKNITTITITIASCMPIN